MLHLKLGLAFIRLVTLKLCFMFLKRYDRNWDKELNNILDNWKRIGRDDYYLTFTDGVHDIDVWIENRFYSFGGQYQCYPTGLDICEKWKYMSTGGEVSYRPSIWTMLRLYRYVLEMN